ncbi:MAG: 1,4-alpha-glucan branching enzyme [Bacillota bacterium]|nr:MAG: 1,4-alpha-glucan branching enzyme [Bacillota bacterium]
MKENLPLYLFHQGTNFRAYEYLGAHFGKKDGKKGVFFRTWAPAAESVSVVGDFNGWNAEKNPMERLSGEGIYETFVAGLKVYDNYKYAVKSEKGTVNKADPYAFHAETPPETASKIYELSGFRWEDGAFRAQSKKRSVYSSPVNIYEVNLGSWKKKADGGYLSYNELAQELVPYVKEMGYTHVEFMPVAEYPFDGSWGYQITGYYAVTSRFGTPHDFMRLVNEFHKAGVGVILDWVPAHFPKDEHGLYEFDGEACYEYGDPLKRENKGWGTRVFDWGKNEVRSFLISNAMFLFETYHIDGLRVDAVASMLYLDYDRKDGEWRPNEYGGNYNLEAISFFRKLNETVFGAYPYALMIAEESTAFPMITKPAYLGGLGFNFKWNMGWMNDTLSYMQTDPYFRADNHNKMTFSMYYAFSENFVLPLSHDEVVHGKRSLLDKMTGDYGDKFANLRAYLGFMYSHPGKKLIFMGAEIGQFKEWAYKEGLEFFLLEYEKHAKLHGYFKELNGLYKNTPAFYEIEDSWDGFEWIYADERDRNILAYKRFSKDGTPVYVAINFSGCDAVNFELKADEGRYVPALNSDAPKFGGAGKLRQRIFTAKRTRRGDVNHFIKFTLPRLTCVYFVKETK